MLTTLETIKLQLGIPMEDISDDELLTRQIKGTSAAIETYCNREFADDYTLPGEELTGDKPRLPYDVEDACIMWASLRYQTGSSIGLSSERIEGLGQKVYAAQNIGHRLLPAPAAVIALIDPYRKMVLG